MQKLKTKPQITIFIFCCSFVFLFQSCRLGKAVDIEKSNNFYYSPNNKFIIYSPMGNWLELGYHEMKYADVKSFTVLSKYWAKDKNQVYAKYVVLLDADAATFRVTSENTGCDLKHVYVRSDYPDTVGIIEDADPATYQHFDAADWTKDKNHVFFRNSIYDADASSFEQLTPVFFKDKNYLYIGHRYYSVQKVDVITSELTKINEHYVRTYTNVYFCLGDTLTTIPVNENSIIESLNTNWIKIDHKVYALGTHVQYPGLDEESFIYFSETSNFCKDKQYVYYGSRFGSELHRIEDADINTFRLIGNDSDYAADKNAVYYQAKIVEGANPKTFIYDPEAGCGKDGKNKYFYGELK